MATRRGAKEALVWFAGCSRFAQLRVPDTDGMLVVWRSNRTGGGCGPAAAARVEATASNGFFEEARTKKKTPPKKKNRDADRNRKLACADWRGRGDQTLAGSANDARCR